MPEQQATELDELGIDSIRLAPPPGVLGAFAESAGEAEQLRGAVGYWCLEPDAVSPRLVHLLGGDGSICVDIHLPTDIDVLAKMKRGGSNVFLHLLRPTSEADEYRPGMPRHLLHPKVLLFELPGQKAELWVGSHNWTARALSGLNIEASLVLRLGRQSPLYSDAVDFLAYVRSRCLPFDLNSIDYYKWLQGEGQDQGPGESKPVLELSASPVSRLVGERLTVYIASESAYRNLARVGRDLILSVNPDSHSEELYDAVVTDTGLLSKANLTFGARLYAVHSGRGIPSLKGPTVPTSDEMRRARFWATVEPQRLLLGFASFELAPQLPPGRRWQPIDALPLALGLDRAALRLFPSVNKPLVSEPIPKERFDTRAFGEAQADLLAERPLVRKKLVRKRDD